MAKEEKKITTKKVVKEKTKKKIEKVETIEAETKEVLDEKELLKEAEAREKERKAEEEKARLEAKKEEEKEKTSKIKEKKAEKVQVRVAPRHGKKYRKLAELIEKNKEYPIHEALDLAIKTSPTKFDATIEFHARINKKEKNIRGMVVMPGGLVKEKRIKEVLENNVDEVIADIKAGKTDFDILIADLKIMPKMAVLAKILGPKGLMPSPKAGTAVEDVAKAVEEIKGGKIEFRVDKGNVVHMPIGKISFDQEKIKHNYDAILGALPFKKIESIYLTTTMGPSVRVAKK